MTSILNIFSDKETEEITENKKISPSLKQGKKFKKYQNKIENSLEKDAEILSGKEGFSNVKEKSLTKETNEVITNNPLKDSSQQQIIENLNQEYQNTLQQYEDLVNKISGNLTDYVDRVNPNNIYLNKVVRFTTGHVCYVTGQGVVKWIPSMEIWKSLNIPQSVQLSLDIPWLKSYNTPGTEIATTPPLVSGTNVKMGQSFGNEGSNVFVNKFLPQNNKPTYMGCYAANGANNNMTFIGGSPPPPLDVSIQNGSFSQPVLSNNSYKYINDNRTISGWGITAVLLNNSKAWGYPIPYPNGNQCISLQKTHNIRQNIKLQANVNYTLTFYACGRDCCKSPNSGNPINIDLSDVDRKVFTNIYKFTPPVNKWTYYSVKFTVPTSQKYTLFFSGKTTDVDRSSAIQNIQLNSGGTSGGGSYSYDACQQAAINSGYRYFALQNVNTSNNLGYCAVSNSQPSVTQYGISNVPNKAVELWSSNTANQTGNSAILQTSGSLQVINSGGQSVYSSTGGTPSNYLGCYNDCYQGRGLPTYLGNGKNYSSCQSAAKSGNWSYFGLQFTQPNGKSECWVGNDISNGMKMGKANNCKIVNGVNVGGGCSNAIYNNKQASSNYFLILQDDGNMCVYRGTGPNDNQGFIWATQTNGKQQSANPQMAATNGKYGKNWMPSGSTLAAGDFISSNNGNLVLIMQSDGNLVLYTYQMETNCQKMKDGNMGGGLGANAAYDIGKTAVTKNMGLLSYIDSDSNLYTYPSDNYSYSSSYDKIENADTYGNDIPGAAFANSTLESCKEACNKNNECAGFIIDKAGNYNKTCFPKTKSMFPFGGPITKNDSLDLYIRGKQPLNPPLGVSRNTNAIDSVTYEKYINKGKISSQYGLANATSAQKQELEQLQSRMNLLANQITDLTNKFQGGSTLAENQSERNTIGIQDYIKDIKNTNVKINDIAEKNNGNIHNILTDSDIVVLQKNYDYLLWSILAAGTVLVSMNIVKKQ